MELDLQSLFGLHVYNCTWLRPRTLYTLDPRLLSFLDVVQLYSLAETPQLPLPPPAFGHIYKGSIGHPRQTTSLCDPWNNSCTPQLSLLYTLQLSRGRGEGWRSSQQIRQFPQTTSPMPKRTEIATCTPTYTLLYILSTNISHVLGCSDHRGADSPPPPHVGTAGKNHLNEEIAPLLAPHHWDRREILPNHIKFRTCSALVPM